MSEEEQRELASWIKAAPGNAQRFAKSVMLHDRLHSEFTFSAETNELLEAAQEDSKIAQFPKNSPRGARWLYPLAAAIALMLTIIYWVTRKDLDGPAFATLAHAVNAQYDNSETLKLGRRLGSKSILLKTGFIRLQFDSGVEVTLQGPAKYELAAANQTRLSEGRLTASVPPGAEGFRVDTPTAHVTDLGTAFGLELDENGASRVSVFSGEVSVAKHGSEARLSLKEGEALRIEAAQVPAAVEFDTSPFEMHWPISSGIERSTGAFKLIPPWRRLRFARSDDHIFVRREGYIVHLSKPLQVNISKPGKYTEEEQLTTAVLPLGQTVKSLILHYQPLKPRDRNEVKRLIGTITFARPILGLITQHEALKGSARRFSNMPAGEARPRRELNLNGRPAGDSIELSSDRRTLRLDLASPMFSSDLIRVIVDAELPTLEMASAL